MDLYFHAADNGGVIHVHYFSVVLHDISKMMCIAILSTCYVAKNFLTQSHMTTKTKVNNLFLATVSAELIWLWTQSKDISVPINLSLDSAKD